MYTWAACHAMKILASVALSLISLASFISNISTNFSQKKLASSKKKLSYDPVAENHHAIIITAGYKL
jgi:hypothetical protein